MYVLIVSQGLDTRMNNYFVHGWTGHGHHHTTTAATVVGGASKTEEGAGLMSSKWKTKAIAGSTLPDCSHACGSCSPCRLVMVSFVCASIEEAESCPVAYRCMCKNKSYPVP